MESNIIFDHYYLAHKEIHNKNDKIFSEINEFNEFNNQDCFWGDEDYNWDSKVKKEEPEKLPEGSNAAKNKYQSYYDDWFWI
jgi:hypothetical protein